MPLLRYDAKSIAICLSLRTNLFRHSLYSRGIQIYCAPTADDRDVWLSTIRHIATEGRCFVVSVNQFARKSDYPIGYPGFQSGQADASAVILGDDEPSPLADVVCIGGSVIVGPLGDILAGPSYDQEIILCAEIDLEDTTRARFDFDPVGHYARHDLFRLSVNDTPQSGTLFASGDSGR